MLIGMADESGFQTGGYFGMAGYLADHDVWAELNPLWVEALKKNGAPYLHMKELSGQPNGVYKGWTEAQRRSLLRDCLHVIAGLPLSAFGAVLKVSDYLRLPPKVQEGLVGPYMACFHETILAVGLSRLHAFPGDRLDMVYSRQDDFKKMMRGLWRWSQENREYGPSLGTLDFQDMRGVPGLQVADLLVYEFRHYYHLRETRPDLDLRLPFRVMLEHQKVLGVKMLKYLPYWVLDFQGAGIIEEAMNIFAADLNTWGEKWREMNVPMMDPLDEMGELQVLEKIRPYDGEGHEHFREMLYSFNPDPVPDYEVRRQREVTIAWPPKHEG